MCVWRSAVVAAALLAAGLWAAEPEFRFEDVTEKVGLKAALAGWELAHAAAWGDVDGDGRPDLYVGAFADRPVYKKPDAPIPNQLFLQTAAGTFRRAENTAVRLQGEFARTTMAFFADLDNDGDLDLFCGQHASGAKQFQSLLFENRGQGDFVARAPAAGDWPRPLGIRNVAPVDLDRDGRLDLVWTDGNYDNWGSGRGRLIALRNNGDWTYKDVTAEFGLPDKGMVGMGLTVGDVNDDSYPDFFVADCCRLLVSEGGPRYVEAEAGRFVRIVGKDSHICGAAFGDLNGDGRLDLVTTEHGEPTRLYVYLHEGVADGLPRYRDVSKELGLDKLWPKDSLSGIQLKTAHLALQDFDNDGRVDLYVAVTVKDAQDQIQPMVLRNLGVQDGLPRFTLPAAERVFAYYAPGPVGDYDRDGRLDILLPNWADKLPTYLFRNTTASGHWLAVQVAGKGPGLNPMGIGAVVRAWRPGAAGKADALLGRRDLTIGHGYSSGEEAIVHFGLGTTETVDLTVDWQGQRKVVAGVKADQYLSVPMP